jgi:hypothetical protein
VDSDCLFGIFWPLVCLFFFDVWILIASLVSFGHWFVCSSLDKPMAKRYQRGNQYPHIEQEQTNQWPKDTKEAIRIHTSKKNRQTNDQKIPKRQSETIASLVSFGHWFVCSCSMCGF